MGPQKTDTSKPDSGRKRAGEAATPRTSAHKSKTSSKKTPNGKNPIEQLGYEQILETTLEGLWVVNAEGRTTRATERMAAMLGYSREEMLGRPYTDFADPAWQAQAEARFRERRKGTRSTYDFLFRRKDGSPLWTLVSAQGLLDDQGRFLGALGMFTDITDRKHAEQALAASEGRYRSVISSMREGVIVQATSGKIVECNEAAERILGLTRDQIFDRTSLDPRWGAIREDGSPFPGDDHPSMITLKTGQPLRGVVMGVMNPAGSQRWILINSAPLHADDGSISGVVTTFEDVTERRRASEAMKRNEEMFRHIVENSPNSFFYVQDALEHYTYISPAVERVLGFPPPYFEAPHPCLWTDSPLNEIVVERERRIWEEGVTPAPYLVEYRHADGQRVTLEAFERPILKDGKVVEVLGLALEVTEASRSQEALTQSREQLRALTDHMSEGLMRVDGEDRILYVNPRLCEMLGHTAEELVGRISCEMLVPEEDRATILEKNRNRKEGVSDRYFTRMRTKAGEILELEVSASPAPATGTMPAGSIGIITDITERKMAEERLRRSEERYRRTLDDMIEGCMLIGFDWTYLYLNDAATRHGRSERERLLGRTLLEMYPGVEHSEVFAHYSECMTRRVPQSFESSYTFADGTTRWYTFSVQPVPEGIFVLSVDVTERVRAQEAIARAAQEWQATFNHITSPIIVQDRAGIIERCNRAFREIVGQPEEVILGRTCHDAFLAGGFDLGACPCQRFGTDGQRQTDERKIGDRTFQVTADPILKGGALDGSVISYADITESVRAQQEIREAKEAWERTFDAVLDPIAIIDMEYRMVQVNRAMADKLGRTPEECVGLTCYEHIHYVSTPPSYCPQGKLLADGAPHTAEVHEEALGGDFLVSVAPIHGSDGRLVGSVHVARDITERKRAEEALRASEEKYRDLVERVNDVIISADDHGVITYISPAVRTAFGYEPEEVIGRPFIEFVHPEDHGLITEHLSRLYDGGLEPAEFRALAKDGSIRWVNTSSQVILTDGLPTGFRGVIRDVTDRKRAEVALRESEERFRSLVEAAPDAVFVSVGMPRCFGYLNPAALRLYGAASAEDLVGQPVLDRIHPSSRQVVLERMQQSARLGKALPPLEEKHLRMDGSVVDVEVASMSLTYKQQVGALVYVRDLTERKAAEQQLALLGRSVDLLKDGAYWMDTEDRFVYINPVGYESLGYGREELLGQHLSLVSPGATPEIMAQIWRCLREEGFYNSEAIHCRKDGTKVPVEIRSTYVQFGGKEYNCGYAHDITERKRAEAALRESEERFYRVFDLSPIPSTMQSAEGRFLRCNRAYARFLGYQESELVGRSFLEVTHPEDIGVGTPDLGRLLKGEVESIRVEKRYVSKEGDIVWGDIAVRAVPGPKGKPQFLIVQVQDVTERKRAEAALSESEIRFRSLVENAPDAIFVGVGKEMRFAYVNPSALKLYGAATQEELLGQSILEHIHPAARARVLKDVRLVEEEDALIPPTEVTFLRMDGTEVEVEVSAMPTSFDGRRAGLVFARDITDRKQSERLEWALYEIARVPETAPSLDDLYRSVHEIIRGLIKAENFYVALYDEERDLISLPYFVDEVDVPSPPQQMGRGLTAHVIRSGAPLLCDAAHSQELIRRGEIEMVGMPSACWLGVPLRIGEKVIGAIVLQHYSDPKAYGERERQMLEYVSSHVAISIQRKREEDALRLSDEQVRLFFEHPGTGMAITSTDKRWLKVNDALCRILGYSREELLALSWADLTPPEDLASDTARFEQLLSGEVESYALEKRYLHKSGQIVQTLLCVGCLRGKDGQVEQVLSVVEDLTERRRAEEALAKSQAQLVALVESTNDLIWSVDVQEFRLLTFNDALRRHFLETRGLEVHEGMTPGEILPQETASLWSGYYLRALREGPFVTEYQTHGGGRTLSLSFNLVTKGQEVIGISVIGRDISERKAMEEALRQSEERFRGVSSSIADVAYSCSLGVEGTYGLDWVTGASVPILGYQGDELRALRCWSALVVEEDQPLFAAQVTELLPGESGQCDLRLRKKDGSIAWVTSYAQCVADDQEPSRHRLFGALVDISLRKQAEEEIARLNAELQTLLRQRTSDLRATSGELDSFAYSVSHDLRAPLRGIDGWSQALEEDCGDKLDEKGREYLATVRSETKRMGLLVDSLLEISRVTRAEMIREPMDLAEVAHQVRTAIQRPEPDRRVEFIIPDTLPMNADPHLIRILLRHLLGNAWKFTKGAAEPRIEVGTFVRDGRPVYFVRDNGAGFDMAFAHKLFKPFQRLHPPDLFPGAGVGLATVQRIVHRHGGRAWAEGEEGKGAAFYFTLKPELYPEPEETKPGEE